MTNAVSLAQGGSNNVTMRNRLINGAMVIDQRNAGALVSSATGYTLDRWTMNTNQNARLNIRQNYNSVTPPAGFTNYLGIVSTGAATVGSTDYSQLQQNIEGYNWADLGWGTANAKTVTLSFWVYSSLTGTFSGSFRDAGTYSYAYPFSYTISSANTWTYISITVPGPTAGIGTWATNNIVGMQVLFNLGCGSSFLATANSWQAGIAAGVTGSVNVVATNGATWYITGVQLEAGTTATPFEQRLYGTELALCQRYYSQYFLNTSTYADLIMQAVSTTQGQGSILFKVSMRAAPTVTKVGTLTLQGTGSASYSSGAFYPTTEGTAFQFTGATTFTTSGNACTVYTSTANSGLTFSAEL